MSYIFEISTETVWSPSLRTGQIYVGYVRALEEAIGTSAGFTPVSNDMIRIDRHAFSYFIASLLEASASAERNPVLRDELKVVLRPSIVMLERGGSLDPLSEHADLIEESRQLAKAMPQ